MQKKYYAALFLGMSITACAMEREGYSTDEDAKRKQEVIQKLTREINSQNMAMPESDGNFTLVERRGIFVIVKETKTSVISAYIPRPRL